ncbi:disintegrin and metalloproteinase domain-containing protein 10-like [Dermacentor andersoni]|uniref:disintegrin and metalloproteinase domain-containing protein 10-like n=1 Tax=Dermacentor andersoni TaxID=34620 RepID=UPI002155489C|nr:disintegrin and metalloproteinase domain-containing protein 10-like [Dermacentor andersoni]
MRSELLFFIIALYATTADCARRLNRFVRHYEPLIYNHNDVHERHMRIKRSPQDYDTALHLKFYAHNRHFHLRLKRDTSVFSNDLVIEAHDRRPLDVDLSHIYSGHLVGEPTSHVFGALHDGVFEGRIETTKGHYYAERANKYFAEDRPYHSIMYSANDVELPDHENDTTQPGCGITEDVRQWMDRVANSAVPDTAESGWSKPRRAVRSPSEERHHHFSEAPQAKYLRSAGSLHLGTGGTSYLPKRRVCNLFVQTDTFLWDHITSTGRDPVKAREEISSLIAQHVEAASRIYRSTNFNGIRDIKFAVQRIRINDSSACYDERHRRSNAFCAGNLDASNFLNLNSLSNHDDFCLAYVWTFRDFQHGTLGLAWVASVNGASGGICEKYKTYSENINGKSENVKRSLNTGIITFLNHNAKIPLKVSEITFAHEIGHNFGSPHDYPPECVPGGTLGNYIMYASATQGHQPNNQRFSPCSIRNISAVLSAILRGEQKENCFQEDEGPFCGNKIVEGDEECDCGYEEQECMENCCYPREHQGKGCTRKPRAICSPSQGPCCTNKCDFERKEKLCKLESDCTELSYCDGKQASCPNPVHKRNKTECNNGTQVCWNGECSGSICEKYGMEECSLTDDTNPSPDKMCEVACQEKDKPESCKSTYEIERMKEIRGIKLRPGSPCNNFHGYCDVFQKCRNVDAEGPLARLKRLLFDKQSLHTVKQWVTLNWWAVLLMMVALIVVMAVFIRCCAVHTPSSNPRKAPALRISDTLRRPGDTFRRKRRVPDPSSMPGGPPPPYPGGPRPSAPPAGPSHGYGHGRGHYNSRGVPVHGAASSSGSSRHHQGSRGAVPPEAVELRPAGKRHL